MDRKSNQKTGPIIDESYKNKLLKKGKKAQINNHGILIPTTTAFILLVILLWLNEIFDLPRLLIGGQSTPFNWEEAIFETLLVVAVGSLASFKITRNISIIKKAERELLESERRLREIVDFLPDPTFAINLDGKVVAWNRAVEEMTGVKAEDILGKGDYEYAIPFYQTRRPMLTDLALRPDDETEKCYPLLHKVNGTLVVDAIELFVKGQIVTLWAKASPILDLDNNTVGAIESVRDITELKRAEEAFKNSEDESRLTLDATTDGIWKWNFITNELFFSPRYYTMLGYEPDEFPASFQSWKNLIHPDDLETAISIAENYLKTKPDSYKNTFRMRTKGGDYRLIHATARVVEIGENDEAIRMIGNHQDITERNEMVTALKERETRFRTVADFTHDWEYWIREDGELEYVSPSCERISGYTSTEFIKDPGLLKAIVHTDDKDLADKHFTEEFDCRDSMSMDFRIITRNGEDRWIAHVCQPVFDADGKFLGRRASNRDITTRHILQEELLKAKKLEAIGVLAGGMAHDFNNLLSIILGNIEYSKMYVQTDSVIDKSLSDAREASLRASELSRLLLTFSSGGRPNKETGSLVNLIKNATNNLLSGSDITTELFLADDIWPVNFDEAQMKQVIYGLITNAQEAVKEEGLIKIRCENIILAAENDHQLCEGKHILVSVEDNGIGIPERLMENIFDPYFSSKEMGTEKGMGLSLSICYSIIKRHGGRIGVKSKLGTGTTFYFLLPAIENTSIEKQGFEETHTAERPFSGLGRILVMDDEEIVRHITGQMLVQAGYIVEFAKEGAQAVDMYQRAKESEQPFDVVILDLTIKDGIGGAEAVRRLIEIDPDIRAIVSTGYSSDPILTDYKSHGFRSAITKPFNIEELLDITKEVLAGKK